jgi:hypothetical protein
MKSTLQDVVVRVFEIKRLFGESILPSSGLIGKRHMKVERIRSTMKPNCVAANITTTT